MGPGHCFCYEVPCGRECFARNEELFLPASADEAIVPEMSFVLCVSGPYRLCAFLGANRPCIWFLRNTPPLRPCRLFMPSVEPSLMFAIAPLHIGPSTIAAPPHPGIALSTPLPTAPDAPWQTLQSLPLRLPPLQSLPLPLPPLTRGRQGSR